VVWLFSCSTSSEKVIELPLHGLGVAELSIFSVVDTANLLYAFRELRVKQEEQVDRSSSAPANCRCFL
jgi:hypothetical protein